MESSYKTGSDRCSLSSSMRLFAATGNAMPGYFQVALSNAHDLPYLRSSSPTSALPQIQISKQDSEF